MEASRTYKSLKRGLRVIEAVVDLGGSATFSIIARKTGLPRSTAHHLLRALVEFGYVIQDVETRHYTISHKLFRLTGRTWTKEQLAAIAMPFLEELSRRTGEGTSLAVLRDGIVTIIAKREPDGPVRVAQEVGAVRPIHCTAVGKALAAWLPARELDGIIGRTVFAPHTSKTITSPDTFRRELTCVRETGIAIDNEEHIKGIRCVAASVRDHSGAVRAALCVIGPKANLPPRRLGKIRQALTSVAAELSERLGYGAAEQIEY
ncbi:MAG: IclR family transcriptional regulator [Desulfobacterales bacterium]|nr:MAG: IclR family transcriptional regulator [Desulfobacterales bacterium]